ncbi:ribonuclease H protein [Pyrus ussuriensis x Pyrus communis]|uniref:Ribonuclease H protein n=1 Tax=Pyrus ussuriensis x Pyrus communis TaxID=2448454 RepID=A0A5N5F4Y6_9ROSA|nr:ribonuclease H protein [Pyrus ussuriensis x Pyrus communis]
MRSLLVDSDRVQWNTQLILKMFFEEEAYLIMTIPLRLFSPPDELIWIKEPKGNFTTKSTYFVVRSCSEICGDILNGSAMTLWKALWRAKVPGKVKICIWRSCLNALPTRVNLKKRRVIVDDCCPFCANVPKTIDHGTLHCSRASTIWFSSPLGLQTDRFYKHKKSNYKLIHGYWSLKKWNVVQKPVKPNDAQTWRRPEEGWFKCNFDGAWDEHAAVDGVGIISKNAAGDFIAALAMKMTGIASPTHAEIAAAREAAVFALQWRTERIIFEGDALLVIAAIQNNADVLRQLPLDPVSVNGVVKDLVGEFRLVLEVVSSEIFGDPFEVGGGVEVDREGGLGGFMGLKEQERRRGCGKVWESGGFDGGVWRRKRELRV